ncbi:MFS transporter [Pseudonocardia hispaniensis]|uniref:MFS transporter n=1 Tax=Pseudonocardia hispaniensis TaxID=904933 RepID=A0ABW1J338_9PSEU
MAEPSPGPQAAAPAEGAGAAAASPVRRGVIALLLGAVLAGFTAQQLLNPVLAPLSREVHLSEFQLGLVITAAAVAFTLASLIWGRMCDRWGHRVVLLTGLVLSALGLAAFAAVAAWALAGPRPIPAVLTAMILTRSLLFGAGIGAVPVAVLAYVSRATAGEAARTKAVSRVGAASALALVLGPGLGGALAVVTLLAPLYLAPAVLAVITVAVAIAVPRPARSGGPPAADRDAKRPGGLSPFDQRLRRYLLAGFLIFLSLGVMQIVLGFLFQDRLGLDATAAAGTVGAAGFATGLVLVAVQGVLVPRIGWGPVRLLRVGTPLAAVGFVVLALGDTFWSMTAGLMVVALGLGLAMPGYTTGATLRLRPTEQGAVAGLVNATNGATFIVGPLVGTWLYQFGPGHPIWVCAVLCVVAAASVVPRP